ncbi:MAG: 16S rRNA (guanine(966)-N(2))-methyltransferase RsmD [Xylophilus ampelinus]
MKPAPRPAARPGAPRASAGPARGAKPGAAPGGAGEIRIVGGRWKRSRIRVPSHPGLRPTPDRVRETLFNWLGQDLGGWRCLDAFAGTGALGLEAASRGAAQVLAVEQDGALRAALRAACERLGAAAVSVQGGDGLAALARAAGQEPGALDLVLLDPPFAAPWFEEMLRSAARAAAADGWVYLEAPRAWSDAELEPLGLALHRHLRAGMVHAHLLRPRAPGAVGGDAAAGEGAA